MRAPGPVIRDPVKSAASWVAEIRRTLRSGASKSHAQTIQRFFKEPVKVYGWRTPTLRKLAPALRRRMTATGGVQLLVAVAGKLFAAPTVEESALGVILLERAVGKFGDREFRQLERWIGRIRDWAACDGLSIALLWPLVEADARRLARVFAWAQSRNQWSRRAAAVSLVPAARRGLYTREIFQLSDRLLLDHHYIVQKGVGWLLKETSKVKPRQVIAYLRRVRGRIPPLTRRIASEKLPKQRSR